MLAKICAYGAASSLCASAVLFGLTLRENRNPAAVILPTPEAINLGIVDQGKTIPFVFQIKNPTSTPILVKSLVPSCGCTWLDDTKEASIAPAESLPIRGTLDTKGRRGVMSSSAILNYRLSPEGPDRKLILSVGATVRPTLRLDPESIVIQLVAGSREKIVRTVAIDSDRVDSFSLFNPESSVPWISTQVVEGEFHKDGPDRRPARLKITIDPTGPSPDDWLSSSTDHSALVRTSAEAEPNLVIPIQVRRP